MKRDDLIRFLTYPMSENEIRLRELLFRYHSRAVRCETMSDGDAGLEGMHCSCLIDWARDSVAEIGERLGDISRDRFLAWNERYQRGKTRDDLEEDEAG